MKTRTATIVALMLLTAPQSTAFSDSPQADGDQQRIRVLVELLASKNKLAGRSLGGGFPRDYDRNAQAVVYLAIQQLLAEGSTAFDVLIEHRGDNRYCYTYAAPDSEYNSTVGEACVGIMMRCVWCYSGEIYYITTEQNDLAPDFAKEDIATWWKRNRHRPLWSIQVDAIDREIALMERVRREKTRVHWRLAEELTPEVFESRRKENLELLKGMRASILARKEAYRPKSLERSREDPYEPIIGLPWTTNPNRY
jgi:hypothetical protein